MASAMCTISREMASLPLLCEQYKLNIECCLERNEEDMKLGENVEGVGWIWEAEYDQNTFCKFSKE